MAMGSALFALEITKRRRRGGADDDGAVDPGEIEPT